MTRGFSRLGADLLVLPQATLANVKAALLVAEPTDETLDGRLTDRVQALPGVARAAPQRIFPGADPHDPHAGHHMGHAGGTRAADVVAFDPARDFTVMPWLVERLPRPLQDGDVILGAQNATALGEKISVLGGSLTVYGRLGRTGVGTHEQAVYVSLETARRLKPDAGDKISGVLVQLTPGASAEAVRFALASEAGVKVVTGGTLVTSVRQSLVALLGGLAALSGLMLAVTALMVGVVYSAVVAERRRELGLLLAVGARSGQVIRMILVESMAATGLGGVCGVALAALLLRLGQRTIVYFLEQAGVSFQFPDTPSLALSGAVCLGLAVGVGLLGAFYPAWRTARQDPYDLIRSEG